MAILLGIWYVDGQAYNRGYDAKKNEYEAAAQKADAEYRDKVVRLEAGYDTSSQKIRKIPPTCVGASVAGGLGSLRERKRTD